MKYLTVLCTALLFAFNTSYAEPTITQHQLGAGMSGAPSKLQGGLKMYGDNKNSGVFFTPQYMPNYPTASTIWPRVEDVDCVKVGHDVVCDGYDWKPGMGRGEYLMFRPKIKEQKVKTRTVYIEVPVKKKAE